MKVNEIDAQNNKNYPYGGKKFTVKIDFVWRLQLSLNNQHPTLFNNALMDHTKCYQIEENMHFNDYFIYSHLLISMDLYSRTAVYFLWEKNGESPSHLAKDTSFGFGETKQFS